MPTATPPAGVPRPLGVGDPAPDFTLADAAGRARRLSSFRGSPVVLAFPARAGDPWDPARAEYVDAYNRLAARVPGGAGARLLSVGGGGEAWRELTFADDGTADAVATLPVVAEDDAAVARAYGVGDGPAVFVIDEAGAVRWRSAEALAGSLPGVLPHPDEVAAALAALAPAQGAVGEGAGWTRRAFVATMFGASLALLLAPGRARAAAAPDREGGDSSNAPNDVPVGAAVPVTLHVNGRDVPLQLEPRVTLLDALREYAGLTGTKKGCGHGQCGACTVHVDGRRVLSCLTLAVMAQGKAVTTVEGLAPSPDALHPVQQAFITHDGFQCGYCTSGQIMSAAAVLHEPWGPSDDDVREAMSGNICRCGAYPGIVAAVQEARGNRTAARTAAGEA